MLHNITKILNFHINFYIIIVIINVFSFLRLYRRMERVLVRRNGVVMIALNVRMLIVFIAALLFLHSSYR